MTFHVGIDEFSVETVPRTFVSHGSLEIEKYSFRRDTIVESTKGGGGCLLDDDGDRSEAGRKNRVNARQMNRSKRKERKNGQSDQAGIARNDVNSSFGDQ